MGKNTLFSLEEIHFYYKLAKKRYSLLEAMDEGFKKFGIQRNIESIRKKIYVEYGKRWGEIKEQSLEIPTELSEQELEKEMEKYFKKHRKTISIKFLSEHFDRSELTVKKILRGLEDRGLAIEVEDSKVHSPREPKATNQIADFCDWNSMTHKWGVIGDTQIGGAYYQHYYMQQMYKRYAEKDVSLILHTGDLFEGSLNMHKGYEYELSLHGVDENVEWAVKNYPRAKNKSGKPIKTYFISGNHDLSFWKDNGIDVVKMFCSQREDCEYLGRIGTYIKGPDANPYFAYLFHPSDGTAYAVSYKDQKMSETFWPSERPQICFTGHYHKFNWIDLMGTDFFQTMCMSRQSDWMKSKRILAVVGALIVEFNISKEGFVNRVLPEKYRFREFVDCDYEALK